MNNNIVPFRPGNVDKKPLMQNIFLTMGPFPLEYAVGATAQVEAQGWAVRQIVYVGTQKASGLAIAQNPSISVYSVIMCKEIAEGTEIVNPTVNFGGPGR
jgi:hypothetical protein